MKQHFFLRVQLNKYVPADILAGMKLQLHCFSRETVEGPESPCISVHSAVNEL